MNESGFTLDVPITKVSRNVIAQNKSLTFVLAAIVLLAVVVAISLNATAATEGSLATEVGSADAARWEAMGEFYQTQSSQSASMNNTLIDGWDRNHDFYQPGSSTPSDSRPLPIDGWDKYYGF